jgi:hypothetical protein
LFDFIGHPQTACSKMAHWNSRNPAVKRIVQELKEIKGDDNPDILAEAMEVREGVRDTGGGAGGAERPRNPLVPAARASLAPGPVCPAGEHFRVALCDPRSLGLGV